MTYKRIGDSDSFVPHPWPKTVFQTALIEAAKSGGGRFGRLFVKIISISEKSLYMADFYPKSSINQQIIEIAPVALSFSYSRQKP